MLTPELIANYTLHDVSRTGIGIVAWVASVSNRVISRKLPKHLLRRQSLGTVEPLLWDTSIQGTQNMEKRSHKSLYLLPLLKGHLYSGEKDTFFWLPKPGFNLHSADTLELKT